MCKTCKSTNQEYMDKANQKANQQYWISRENFFSSTLYNPINWDKAESSQPDGYMKNYLKELNRKHKNSYGGYN